MKKIMVLFQFSEVSSAQYEGVWTDLRSTGNANPAGLIHHVGAPDGSGWCVCDVWESQETFMKFGETLMPLLAKHNIPATEPTIMPVNYEYNRAEVLETI